MTTELMILKIGVACFTLLSLILIWIFYACRRLKVKICIHKNSGVYKFFFFFFFNFYIAREVGDELCECTSFLK